MTSQQQPDAGPTHLVFITGTAHYGVPAECAQEVVVLPELTRVPGAPAHLRGVFAHRGEVIPVVDLSVLTGGAPEETRRAVLLRLPKGTLALAVRKVTGVAALAGAHEPLGTAGVQAHLRGPAKVPGGGEVALIHPEGLFDFLALGGQDGAPRA